MLRYMKFIEVVLMFAQEVEGVASIYANTFTSFPSVFSSKYILVRGWTNEPKFIKFDLRRENMSEKGCLLSRHLILSRLRVA